MYLNQSYGSSAWNLTKAELAVDAKCKFSVILVP